MARPPLARPGTLALLACLAAAALVAPRPAAANGRFPASRFFVVGPGDSTSVMALQTTFGIEVSADNGGIFRHRCEDVVGFSGEWDPPLAIASDGTLVVGLPEPLGGVVLSRQGHCEFVRPPTGPTASVYDLATDATGDHVVAAVQPFGTSRSDFYYSEDRGTSWRQGGSVEQFFVTNVDFAPSLPSRVYASGYDAREGGAMYRSDDGGATMRLTSRDFHGARDAFLAAVDPTRPDVLYVRSNLDRGTMLLRSVDGGGTFCELTRTHDRMTGFAMAPDGRRLWVGSPGACESVVRSTDGGETWRAVATGFLTLCLRYHAGVLYACGDLTYDNFALQRSTDDGEHFEPMLRYDAIRGPDDCVQDAGSSEAGTCADRWPAVHATLIRDGGFDPPDGAACGPGRDAGFADGEQPRVCYTPPPTDGGAPDVVTMDAALDAPRVDGGDTTTRLGGGGMCSCRAAGAAGPGARGRGALAVLGVLAVVLIGRRKRARRERDGTRDRAA